ncbi:MAG: YihY/virulence factor BrkB family protein [Hyphomicrobiaceae bacterium]|nr:YihY/virulence factor BrkB family protein [Hyphomicrobiaceae bacterium]
MAVRSRVAPDGGEARFGRQGGDRQRQPEHGRPLAARSGRAEAAEEAAAPGWTRGWTGGWTGVLWDTYQATQKDRVMLIAAGVTYYGLLALFPAIAALVSLYGLFADPEAIRQQLSSMEGVLPAGAIEVIGGQITRIQGQGSTLGVYFFIGLLISLWSANAGVKSIFDALNALHEEPERRGFIQYNLQALAFTLGAIVFVILALGAIVVLPAVFAFIGLESMAGLVISLLRWPLLLVVTLVGLALLYSYGPSREKSEWRWMTWGSGIAAVVWLAGSMLFSWYVSSFGTFNETYGSLGAVIGFMIWIWLSAVIVLVGAEIDAQLERRKRP